VVWRNAAGQVASVDIIDFKTNHLDDHPEAQQRLVEHYRPQMDTYRDVVRRLLSLEAQPVRRILVFSAIGRIAVL
jgi:ATP-dependent exoDNAse (exonuclease V) beta subunit